MLATNPLRVLIAGADPLARRGLAEVVTGSEALELVGQVSLGGSLAVAIQLHRPDAVVLDAEPTGPIELVQGVPFLVLARDADHAGRALSRGARGALSRAGDLSRVAPALSAIDRGLIVLDDEFLDLWQRPSFDDSDVDLTPREVEVLSLLAEGFSNREIGESLGISAHTAKFHVNAVLAKLDSTTRTEAVARAARLGLLRL